MIFEVVTDRVMILFGMVGGIRFVCATLSEGSLVVKSGPRRGRRRSLCIIVLFAPSHLLSYWDRIGVITSSREIIAPMEILLVRQAVSPMRLLIKA